MNRILHITICLLGIAISHNASAQNKKEFIEDNFSEKYYAVVYYTYSDEGMADGIIKIFDKKKKRIQAEAEFSTFYDSDSSLIFSDDIIKHYQDYNFDGLTDLAIYQGPYGTYGSPTYNVYLAKSNGFVYDKNFSNLTNNYGYEIDSLNKRLKTFESGGCCWHQVSEYEVRNNKPFLVYRYTENGLMTGGLSVETYEIWDEESSQLVKNESKFFEGSNGTIFSFNLENDLQQLVVYSIDTENLSVVLCNADENNPLVEVCYPDSFVYTDGYYNSKFLFDNRSNVKNLCFTTNSNTIYCIYESEEEVGCISIQNGEEKRYKGVKESQYGSLNALKEVEYKNLETVNR